VGDGTQILEGVSFLLQRIIGRGRTLDLDLGGLEFEGLLCLGRQSENALDDEGRADVLLGQLLIVIQFIRLNNDLKIFQIASVIQLNKAKGIGCVNGSCPSCDGDLSPCICLGLVEQLFHCDTFHELRFLSPAFRFAFLANADCNFQRFKLRALK
jgi:hypothetical protein